MDEQNGIPGYDKDIEIVEYDPEWPDRFEREAVRIEAALDEELLGIEHLGSTSVPGLAAKPIIDVGLIFASMDAARNAVGPLERIGYRFGRDRDGWFTLYRWDGDGQQFNVGACSYESDRWRRNVLFREYLRDHPDARAEYAAVKRKATTGHPRDVSAYTDAKRETIESIVRRAREDGYEQRL